jgi:serine/threonine-protein kinase
VNAVQFRPLDVIAYVRDGDPLVNARLAKTISLSMACGGKGACSTCHVYILQGKENLTAPTESEVMILAGVPNRDVNSRLACQCQVIGKGVIVEIPTTAIAFLCEELKIEEKIGESLNFDLLDPLTGEVVIAQGKIISRLLVKTCQGILEEVQRRKDALLSQHSNTNKPEKPPSPVAWDGKPVVNRDSAQGLFWKSAGLSGSIQGSKPGTESKAARTTQSAMSQKPSRSIAEVPAVGKTLGACLLVEELGQGAAGKVFRAWHRTLNCLVAVKILQRNTTPESQEAYQQLCNEVRILSLIRHENIVRLHDFVDDPVYPYVILESIEGLTLQQLIAQSQTIRPKRALQIIRQVAEALQEGIKHSIIHRDVKPSNILLTRNGDVKLADLGLAILQSDPMASRNEVIGTALYMAPEVFLNPATIDFRADMYSLGVTLFECLTGTTPFTGKTAVQVAMHHMNTKAPLPSQLMPEISAETSEFVLKMLEKDASARFESYAKVIEAIDVVLAQLSG